jgi:hypothetical protein
VLLQIVSEHKGDCLPLFNANPRNETFAQHRGAHFFSKLNRRTATLILSPFNGHVQLQLDILAVKGCNLALFAERRVNLLEERRDMRVSSITKRREYLDI